MANVGLRFVSQTIIRVATLLLLVSPGTFSQAIYVPNFTTSTVSGFVMNPSTGALAAIRGFPVTTGTSPIQALIHPSGKFLYVLNSGSGDITLFSITAPSGALAILPCPNCDAPSPTGMAVDPAGESLFVTSLASAIITPYRVNPTTGALIKGAAVAAASGSKLVSPVVDPSGRYLYVADSNVGRIFGYLIAGASLTSVPGSPFFSAAGVSSLAASRTAVFAANQLSGDVSMYQLGPAGTLTRTGIPLPTGGNPTSVAVDPSGSFVYVANQIQLVALNTSPNGPYPLTYLRAYNAGTVPSFTTVEPEGNFVYLVNSVSNDISGFSISAGGTLIPAGAASTTGSSGSRILTVRHIGDTTAISVTPGSNTAPYGTPITIKGVIRNTAHPGTIPSGSVVLSVNDVSVPNGTAALDAAGAFSLVLNASAQYLPLGSNVIQFSYSPGTGFEAPSPVRMSYTVTQALPTFTISPPLNAIAGKPASLVVSAAQVGGRYPTGFVNLSVDGTVAGTAVPLTNGAASVTYTASTGSHSVTATYTGDSWFLPATAAPVKFIAKRITSTVVTATSKLVSFGQDLVLTATVSAAGDAIAGTIDFFDDGASLNPAPLPITAGQAQFTAHSLRVGAHSITVRYSGDVTSLSSDNTASPLTITVQPAPTNVSSPQFSGTAVYGPLTFSVGVVPSISGSVIPSGSVSLNDNATSLAKSALVNGAAIFTVSLNAGTHALTAAYSGDTNYQAAISTPMSLVVAKATPSLTVRSVPDSPVSGQTVRLIASLGGSAPATGTVVFYDSGVKINSDPIPFVSGQASFSYTANGTGIRRISAIYSGDANCNSVNTADSPLVFTVSPASTITSTPTTSGTKVFGQPLTLTASVTVAAPGSGAPSGTLTFRDGAVALGTAPLQAGVASLTTSAIATGDHTISAVYGGGTNFAGSTSATLPFIEDKSPTLIILNAAQTPTSTVLKASVSGSPPATPGGSVQFFNGTSLLGNAPLLVASGSLSATLSLGAFSGIVTAVYAGDSNFQSSTSAPISITVAPRLATSLAMQVTPTPATIGQSITCTVGLSWSGAPTPAGSVQLTADGNPIAEYPARGQVAFTPTLAAGNHLLVASYTGDSTYLPSSVRSTLVVSRNPAGILLTAGTGIAVFGQSVTVTAKMSIPSDRSIAPPAGKITFVEGATVLVDASLVNGVAIATLPTLEPGFHQITAVYAGDNNWDLAASNAVSVTVAKTPTALEISVTPDTLDRGGMSLAAKLVVNTQGAGAPSGSVRFVEAVTGRVLAAVPLNGTTAAVSLPAGLMPNTVIAIYPGDARFADSRSASETKFSVVNAASYANIGFAADQIVTVFCPDLTSETLASSTLPLPFQLGGVTVDLIDSAAAIHHALLFYLSPGQLSYLMPSDMPPGPVTLRIASPPAALVSAVIRVAAVSPGLFAANANGEGPASAQIIRVHPDGTQDAPEDTAAYDAAAKTWTSIPIAPAANGDDLYLVLYATGMRHHSTPATVTANGQSLSALYAGRQPTFFGLDQVNALLPPALQRGRLDLSIAADGSTSNTVTLVFQ